jgi:nicotinamide mononucleotide transporter
MTVYGWMSNNYIELLGAVAGIVYVFLEIRQSIWLWPIGIITSAVYIWVFFTSKFYADMSLQMYYLGISILGWYWWSSGAGKKKERENGRMGEEENGRRGEWENGGRGEEEQGLLVVTRLKVRVGIILAAVFVILYFCMCKILNNYTDSPVPEWDAFITSLSIVATWMLARKIFEHWFLWIAVNTASVVLFSIRGLYPTLILYLVYFVMSFVGLKEWRKTIQKGE